MTTTVEAALESLSQIMSTEPPSWLVPNQELSQAVRVACKHLFSNLTPHSPKSPFDQLHIEGFDAEQIWQQIDLQEQPLLSSVGRELKKFKKHPEEIFKLKEAVHGGDKKVLAENETDNFDDNEDSEDDIDMGEDEDEDDDDEEEDRYEVEKEEENVSEEEEKGGIEDKFLKIKELQDYLEEDEAREFGLKGKKKTKRESKNDDDAELEDDDEEGESDDDDDDNEAEEEEDELGLFDGDDEDDEIGKEARYYDLYSSKKNKAPKGKGKFRDSLEGDSGSDDEHDVDKRKDGLSTHEKEVDQLKSKIEQMEKANLDPKVWTMRGEITAAQRQKNSALEVDLDFEHNVRPAPVITEEVTESLEDLIKTRISEGRFDDVQKAPTLSSKAPREIKELDENKSKKGLAEVYEEEFVQKTDPASAPLTFSDEQKKEASMLFKKLCLKLDALSHFHFTPKPVVEDMSIQTNVPALAMEEIAPMAVSDAAMLAPEEVFSGKGDIKEETELTKAERKRRRANKKRKFKAEATKRMANKQQRSRIGKGGKYKEKESRVLDIDYAYQALTLHDPHMSTCDTIVLGGRGNGFAVEQWRAPYFNPTADNVFMLIGCSADSPLFQGFPGKHLPCRNVSGMGCEEYYDCPAWMPVGHKKVGSGPPECCAVAFESIKAINLSRLQCEGYSSAYSLAPLRVDGAGGWSYGIRVKYSVQGNDEFCRACEATGGACGFGSDGVKQLCMCGSFNSTTNCDSESSTSSKMTLPIADALTGIFIYVIMWMISNH